jgi:diguanylate cyclase (GGDEF)-like protein
MLLAAFLILSWEAAAPVVAELRLVYPAVFIVGIVQSWRFHRSRLFYALIVLAMADWFLLRFAAGEAAATGVGHVVFIVVALLLPLNILLLSLLPERGPFTVQGIATLAALGVQPALVIRLLHANGPSFFAVLDRAFLASSQPEPWTAIPQPALAAFLAAFVFFTSRFFYRPDGEKRTLVWMIIASFIALNSGQAGTESASYLAMAGVMVVVSVIDTSYRLAYQDALTGLPTRRGMFELLYQTVDQYTVGMVDVDHFKQFNDKHGHDVGDQVLRMVASELSRVTGGGRAFRYGGEEFSVIFAGRRVEYAQSHLENLRARIAGKVFTIRGPGRPRKKPEQPKPVSKPRQTLQVTVSMGAADNTFRDGEMPEDVIKAADEALYAAKQAGRNRVRVRAKPKI